MITVYGIPNCSSVKKARTWLDARGIDYQFHDFKKQGVAEARLAGWIEACGLERVLNRKGTSWRALSDSERAAAADVQPAIALMCARPTLIKRPVIETDGQVLLGFDETHYEKVFG